MATSSYGTFLMVKGLKYQTGAWTTDSTTGSYAKLVDIKDFPNLGGDPELIETTTLSDKMQTNIFGIQSLDTLQFTANYTLDDMKKLNALKTYIDTNGAITFEVWFSTTGEYSSKDKANEGRYKFNGTISSYPIGKGVNEVREIQISIAAATEITLATD